MKKLGFLFVFIWMVSNQMDAQQITINYIESRLVTHQGVTFIGNLKEHTDDIYSYSNWNNNGVIFMNNEEYYLANLNFNVTTNSFESRIKRDELFSYKSANLDSVIINEHLFKKVGNYFYEVIFEKENNLLLKKHDIKYKPGSINRIDGKQAKGTTSLTYKYLIKSDDEVKMIELNKKSILGLLEEEKERENLEAYVREENLSYKKEKDTAKIFDFIIENSGKII